MANITNRLLRNVAWNGLNEAIGKGAIFFSNVYLARVLGPNNYGIFVLSQSICMYVILSIDLGTTMYGTREIGKNKENAQEFINTILTIRQMMTGLIFSSYIIVIMFFFDFPPITKLTFLGSGLYLLVYSFYTDWALKGLEKFNLLNYGGIAFSMSYLAGILLLVKSKDDVAIAAFIWTFSFFISALTLIIVLYCSGFVYRPCFHWHTLWHHTRESITFTISGLIGAAYHYLPIFLIGKLLTQQDLGLFSAPYRTITSLMAPGFYIATAFFPALSDAYYNNRIAFKKMLMRLHTVMLFLGVLLGTIGYVFSESITMFLLGNQFTDSARIFAILVLLLPLSFLRNGYINGMRASGYQLSLIIPYSTALVMLLSLYLVLRWIRVLDLFTFSIATVLAEIVMMVVFMVISKITYDR